MKVKSTHMTDTSAASSPSSFDRWRIVVLLMGYTALAHFNREGLAVAGSEVFIKKLGLSEVEMGWVYTSFGIVYTTLMLLGGWLVDRFGSARVLTLLGLTMGTVVALTGTLTWLSNTPASLFIGLLLLRGLTGACSAPLHPGAAHVASDLMPDRHRATANGMRTAGALIGIAFSYPIFGWLMDTFGWPWAFVVSGSALIVFGVLWKCVASPSLPAPQPSASVATAESDSRAAWLLLRQGNLWLLSLSYAAYSYLQYLFFYWLDYYFKMVLKVSDADSRRASFYIFLAMGAGMAIGGLSTGVLCKRLGTIRGRRCIVMTGLILGALFARLGVQMDDYLSVSICLAISMCLLGMCEGVFWTTATDIGGKARGFSGAFLNTVGNIGGFIAPVLTPFLAESMGWPGAISVACVIAGLGGLIWFWIKPPPT
ncbi:MAG: MFS transporter [Planctomycetota bacterium]|nr:MAG: MFS transporter [Planctomycetota bacterium]